MFPAQAPGKLNAMQREWGRALVGVRPGMPRYTEVAGLGAVYWGRGGLGYEDARASSSRAGAQREFLRSCDFLKSEVLMPTISAKAHRRAPQPRPHAPAGPSQQHRVPAKRTAGRAKMPPPAQDPTHPTRRRPNTCHPKFSALRAAKIPAGQPTGIKNPGRGVGVLARRGVAVSCVISHILVKMRKLRNQRK